MHRPTGINVLNTILSSSNDAKIITLVVDETDSTPVYLNDPVKTLFNSDEITGYEKCARATPSDFIRGIVVGVQAEREKEDIIYRKANTKRFLLVREDPFILCQVTVNAAILATDVNKYLNIDNGGGDIPTATSEIALDYATINDASGQFRITRISKIVDTDDEKYSIVDCVIQKHEYMQGHTSGGDNWDRTGTTLIPTNAGDSVDLGAGDISATDGNFTGNVEIDGKLTVDGSIDPTDLQLTPQAVAPATEDGTIYYNSVEKQFKFRENAGWSSLATNLFLAATTYYIDINGSDTTGNGSLANPFLTVQKAINFIKTTFTPSPTLRFTVRAVSPYNFPESVDLTNADYIDLDLPYCNFRCNTFIIGGNNIVTIGQLERLSGIGNVIQKKGIGKSILNIGTLKNDLSFGLIETFNGTLEVYAKEVLGTSRNATIVDFDSGASDSRCIIRANTIQGRSFTTTISSQFYLYADYIDGDGDINPGAASIGAFIGRKWQGNILNAGALSTVVVSVLERNYVVSDDNIDQYANFISHQYRDILNSVTGLIEGCQVSVGSTTQQYSVTEGWGQIVNNYTTPLLPTARLQYIPAVTDATDPYTTLPFTGLAAGSDGIITPLPATLLTTAEKRDKITIGSLTHQDFTQITKALTFTETDVFGYLGSDISDALGILQEQGKEFKISPYATDTRLKISNGLVMADGIRGRVTAADRKETNTLPVLAKSPMIVIYIFRDGLGGYLTWSTTTPQVGGEEPTLWDDGTVVTPGNPPNGSVTSNQWTVQRHYKDPANDLEIALFSQVAGYGNRTIALTERVIEQLVVPEFLKFWVPLQQRVLENNAAFDNSNTTMAVTVVSGRFDNSAIT